MRQDHSEQDFIDRVMNHQSIVHKVCSLYCDTEEDRKDLFQEILINLWKSYSSFRGQSKFSTWMYRVALNVALQQIRKDGQNKEYTLLPGELDRFLMPREQYPLQEEKHLMYKAIKQLNEVERAVIMLYLDEKGNEEIAEIIGISQNYVRVKMTRIRKKLKKLVEA
jgi:RNA polymerase sigma-70 factor (ECF subfamily)